MTLDQLIEKYPKIFEDYEGNPHRVNWDCPKGWISVIDKLCGSVQHYINNTITYNNGEPIKPNQITCSQMKEKFGGLRFYTNGHDDIVDGMIQMAEYMCDNTCQDCGSEHDLGITSGWITVLCRTCAIGHGDRAMEAWRPKTQQIDNQ